MEPTLELSDDAFVQAFCACSLPPDAFNHRNHLRITWIYLQRLSLDEAIECTCVGIARFAAHLGAEARFNRTLTEALVRLAVSHGAADRTVSWEAFLARAPELLLDCKAVLARHYSAELIACPEARYKFIPPDRLPLPA